VETSTIPLSGGVWSCGVTVTGVAPGERIAERISSAVPVRVSAFERRFPSTTERPPMATNATAEAATAISAPRRGVRPARGTSSIA
jgi:hypothetical protein